MRIVLLILSLLISLSLMAKPVIQKGFFIFDDAKKHLTLFQSHDDLTIDLVAADGYELYGPEGLSHWLDDLGIKYLKLDTKDRYGYYDQYPSNAENTEKLRELADRYPNILKLFSIGTSIRGQELWVMKISDNVDQDEIEPEFKYIANMHGNEITGREMMIKLIEELAQKYYERDQQISNLIDNTEIFIIPTMNPDGSDLHRRGNADWVDLNRDFPDFLDDPVNTSDNRAPETAAVMAFQASRHFALSANLHDGATVVNYPWDTTLNHFPFNDLIVKFSKEYASIVPGMYDSASFTDGITNGAQWYIIHGGMQDWSYFWHDDLQVTLEISISKWPSYSSTMNFYQLHRNSLITYISRVHQGAGFKFEEMGIEGTVKIYRQKMVGETYLGEYGFDGSEFYKVLEEGKYRFIIKPANAEPITIYTEVQENTIAYNGNYVVI